MNLVRDKAEERILNLENKIKLLEAKILQFHTILEMCLNEENMEFLKLEITKSPINNVNGNLLFEKMADQPVLKLYNEHFGIQINRIGKIEKENYEQK